MRFLLRLAVLALAAVGAKTLYDRFAPKATEMRGPAGDVLDTAKSAARDVTRQAKDAAAGVADQARRRAGDVRDEASDAVQRAHDAMTDDDAPTSATPSVSAHA
jgi:hypothetical protein